MKPKPLPGPARLAAAASFFVAAVPGTGPAPFPLQLRFRVLGVPRVPGSAHRVAGSRRPVNRWQRGPRPSSRGGGRALLGRTAVPLEDGRVTFERKTAQTLDSPFALPRRRSDAALLARGVPARLLGRGSPPAVRGRPVPPLRFRAPAAARAGTARAAVPEVSAGRVGARACSLSPLPSALCLPSRD